MPIVRATRRVAPTALPGARVSAPSGTGAAIVPQALQRTGQDITRLGGQLQAVERQEAAIDAQRAKEQAVFKERSDKLWASQQMIKTQDYLRDKGPTFTAGKGSAAIGSTDAASQDLEKFKTSILDSAQNNEQRALYEAAVAPKREVWLNKQKAFEVDQFRKDEVVTNDSKIANAMREAADSPNDELAFFSAAEDLREGIDVKIQGMSPEQRKNVTAEYVSAFYEGVLNTKVSANAENAKEFYEKNKKSFLPENRPAIEKTLETEDTLQFAQKKTDELMLTYPDDYAKQLEVAREIADPNKRKATVDLTKTRKKESDQHQKEVDHEVWLTSLNNILNAPNLEAANEIVNRIENPEERIKAQKVADNKFEKKTVATKTDRKVQADVYEKIDNNIIKTHDDLIEFLPYLSEGHYDKALTRIDNRDKAVKGIETDSVSMAEAKASYALVKGEKFEIDENSKEFMYVQEGLETYKNGLGRKPTPVELNKETANLLINGEDIGGGFFGGDPNKTLMQATQDGTLDTWLPRVNDEDVDGGQESLNIKDAFERRGIKVEDDNLFRLYKKKVILKQTLSQKEITLFNSLLKEAERTR